MSYFIKIGANRLKQCPNKIKWNESLKVYHNFCENM
jgi:hypothetical protein